jgi:hypothetical protein
MAKRASSRKSGIVVAKEIRALIEADNDIRGPEVMLALREKFPRETFNDKSCQVSYANIRSRMGLSRTLKKKPLAAKGKRGRPVGRPAGAWRQASGFCGLGRHGRPYRNAAGGQVTARTLPW